MNQVARRSRFQLSLRTFFILILLVSLTVGWGIRWRQRTLLQRDVIRNLLHQDHSGMTILKGPIASILSVYDNGEIVITYDYQQSTNSLERLLTAEPSSLSSIFGVDAIHSVKEIDFYRPADEKDLKELRRLHSITHVRLKDGITHECNWNDLYLISSLTNLMVDSSLSPGESISSDKNRFEQIEKLGRLTELHIADLKLVPGEWDSILQHAGLETLIVTSIDDFEPGKKLETNKRLKKLFLIDCRAIDSQLHVLLDPLPNLEFLSIEGKGLPVYSDQIFPAIAELSKLEELYLYQTKIRGYQLHLLRDLPIRKLALGLSDLDDEGLAKLVGFKKLEYLEVGSTKITDLGMKSIAQLTNLKHLSIRDTAISDQGLKEIRKLRNLNLLRVRDTQITDEAVQEFRRELPNCVVEVR